MSDAIKISNLTFQYSGSERVIFSDFSWEVSKGDFWVIVGANGSGKTSLIRLLLGLEHADRGDIVVLSRQLKKSNGFSSTTSERITRSKIGYVPQHLQFDHRLPISVLDVVEGGTLPFSFWCGLTKGSSSKQRQEVCIDALTQVGVEALAKQQFSLLSGGQKQRVLIARALATQSPILILDEPTASVDPTAAQEIIQICQKLRKKHTVLFISHDIGMIPDVCEFILCMSPATSQELLTNSRQGTMAHSHDVRGMTREEILLLLYGHWGLPVGNAGQ